MHNLVDLTEEEYFIGKELVLVKLSNKKQYRKKTLDIANKFNACILSDSEVEMILENVRK